MKAKEVIESLKQIDPETQVDFELMSNIDNRIVKCGCGNPSCKIGLNFDNDIMILTNKYGNETTMQLTLENIDVITEMLKNSRTYIKNKIHGK